MRPARFTKLRIRRGFSILEGKSVGIKLILILIERLKPYFTYYGSINQHDHGVYSRAI